MLKGLAITPPVIGRISIGKVVERNGKRLPHKDDEFTITTQVQTPDGWLLHPLDKVLRLAKLATLVKAEGEAKSQADDQAKTGASKASSKLRSIPVRLLFDDPDLNLRANYSMFDRQTGRQVCVGNGETCKRVANGKVETLVCPTPVACPLGQGGFCKPYGRLNVRVDVDGLGANASGDLQAGTDDSFVDIPEADETGSFIFRTTGFNSIRTLAARLQYFAAVCGGKLSAMPLELRLRGKSTTQSHRTPIYYVDLVVRSGMNLVEAVQSAQAVYGQREAGGFDQFALDAAARAGFANGEFEESEEEGLAVVEEFYPVQGSESDSDEAGNSASASELNVQTAGAQNLKTTDLKSKLSQVESHLAQR